MSEKRWCSHANKMCKHCSKNKILCNVIEREGISYLDCRYAVKFLKAGERFAKDNNEYIVTNIPVVGSYFYYAVNVKTGNGIKIRPDIIEDGLPFISKF